MDNPNVALLCLEQRDRTLEINTRDFLELACQTHYPDRSLCVFYISSLSEWSKARLPGSGPRDNFATCLEWVLENNGLYFSICPAEDISSPTPKPVTSQPSSRCTEISPEPTPDGEPEPAMTREPELKPATEPIVTPEPEPQEFSDQVREPASSSVPEGGLVEIESLEGSPTHTPAAEG